MADNICPHTKKEYDCARCDGASRDNKNGSYNVHLSQSITGPLSNWTKQQWKDAAKYMTSDDGSTLTGDQLKQEFIRMNGQGWECFPVGDCDIFCYKNGCQGHLVTKE